MKIKTILTLMSLFLVSSALAYDGKVHSISNVISIHDGDTIRVEHGDKEVMDVRFAGIDAPELKQTYGIESRDNLAKNINACKKGLFVYAVTTDKYKRTVGFVVCGKVDLNLKQIKSGSAHFYKKYSSDLPKADQIKYEQEYEKAKTKAKGLFKPKYAPVVFPSDFRHPVEANANDLLDSFGDYFDSK